MGEEERAVKRLEWLQSIITRMANNSFLLKGWGTTIAAALLAFAAKEHERSYALLALYPALVFWMLDAKYLQLERKFRARYEELAAQLGLGLSLPPPAAPKPENKAAPKRAKDTFGWAFIAWATWPIYVAIVVPVVLIVLTR